MQVNHVGGTQNGQAGLRVMQWPLLIVRRGVNLIQWVLWTVGILLGHLLAIIADIYY